MNFTGTPIAGAWLVEPQRHEDERGFFARVFDEQEFARRELCTHFPQCSVSFNARAATLRGMHYQAAPHAEAKLVRCTAGNLFDVILDLRPGSATERRWWGVELTAENRRALYIPEGVAHGFQTLADATEVFYQISRSYQPSASAGVRWDDPAFAIEWPAAVERTISARDRAFPLV